MKRYVTVEIWVDDELEDCKQCADEVIDSIKGHEYCCDGTIKIKVFE